MGVKEDRDAAVGVAGHQREAHGGVAEGQHIAFLDLIIRDEQLVQVAVGIVDGRDPGALPEHPGIRLAEVELGAEHLLEEVRAADVVQMAVGVDDPLDVLGVEPGLPDGLHQHIGAAAVAGIDQQQTVAGVDQVDAHPAVAHIPHIAPDAEGMDVAVQRVQPDGAEVGLGQRLAAGSVIFVFLFDGHGSFSFTDCITV